MCVFVQITITVGYSITRVFERTCIALNLSFINVDLSLYFAVRRCILHRSCMRAFKVSVISAALKQLNEMCGLCFSRCTNLHTTSESSKRATCQAWVQEGERNTRTAVSCLSDIAVDSAFSCWLVTTLHPLLFYQSHTLIPISCW